MKETEPFESIDEPDDWPIISLTHAHVSSSSPVLSYDEEEG